jgi:hypothetical protein
MQATDYFSGTAFGGPSWLRWAMLAIILLAIALGAVFFVARSSHDPKIYSPKLAWVRAWIYYCFVILFSWVSGALGYVLSHPLIAEGRTDDLVWLAVVGACWLVSFWGYAYWWPRGTLTHGRKLYLGPAIFHGAMWGLCAGLLYLSMYAMLEQFGFPGIVNALLLVAVLSAYNLNYQVGWWDIFVSPPHNLRATNNGKVAGAHQPFLIATLTLLVMYGDGGMYVLLTIFVMACSSVAMRFPAPWANYSPEVSRDTAMGE